jgi:DNA-binding PadR family transcriptional regulator
VIEEKSSRNRRLYGRRRVPRYHRRVMLVLLAEPAPLPGFSIAKLAMTQHYGQVQTMLWRLEKRGWLTPSTGAADRRCYQVTVPGRLAMMELLGLPRA